METQLTTTKPKKNAVAPVEHTTPDQLLTLAINKDLDIEKLGKLMELQKQYNEDMARKAFFAAIGEFQATVPEIRKNKKVFFETKTGGKTDYNFAPLSDIVRQIKDACSCPVHQHGDNQSETQALRNTKFA